MASSVPSTFKMGRSVVIASEMHEILNAMSHALFVAQNVFVKGGEVKRLKSVEGEKLNLLVLLFKRSS